MTSGERTFVTVAVTAAYLLITGATFHNNRVWQMKCREKLPDVPPAIGAALLWPIGVVIVGGMVIIGSLDVDTECKKVKSP